MVKEVPETRLIYGIFPFQIVQGVENIYKYASVMQAPQLRQYPAKFAAALVREIPNMKASSGNRFTAEVPKQQGCGNAVAFQNTSDPLW